MERSAVLIIGAGAAGLMAAYQLSQQGKTVTVLEARNRTGGRIHTINHESFFRHAELGAEFVHGDLPVTLKLLKEAKIPYSHAGGNMVQYKQGKFTGGEQFIENWDLLLTKLNQLKTDKSIDDFLQQEFGDDAHQAMRDAIWRYVSGYDTADPRKASCFALRREWQDEDDDAQHRVDGGYCRMIEYLANRCKAGGGHVFLNSIVKEIYWEKDNVQAITSDGSTYNAGKLIIALPLGVLQAGAAEPASIRFHPPLPRQNAAIQAMGFGAIIKFLLEFDKPFWENAATAKLAGNSLKEMAFLLSDEEIPTWWTQYPAHSPLLTGWLGGPPAENKKNESADELLKQALQSLSRIFKIAITELKDRLIAWNVVNWTSDPYTLGSYSYDTIAAAEARKDVLEAVEETLFFTGEYLYDGPAMGTVEAALTSGQDVAKRIGL